MLFLCATSNSNHDSINQRLQNIEKHLTQNNEFLVAQIERNKQTIKEIYAMLKRFMEKNENKHREIQNALMHIYSKVDFPMVANPQIQLRSINPQIQHRSTSSQAQSAATSPQINNSRQ
jgi:hypothetical protein